MYGSREEAAWNTTRDPVNFFDLKGMVETLLEDLLIPEVTFTPDGLPDYLRYGARVFSGGRELGVLGELRPDIGERLDLEGDIFGFNLNFAALCQSLHPAPLHVPAPLSRRFTGTSPWCCRRASPRPGWRRPFTSMAVPGWWKPASLTFTSGDPVPAGKRSLAFRLSYRDPERTLTDDLVNSHHQALVTALERDLGAELR